MDLKGAAALRHFMLSPDMLSITSIRLDGSNHAQWAQAVEVFLLGRKKFDYVIQEPLCLQTLTMLIGEPKMHKLGVACGIAWSLRLVVVWFSYQLLNLKRIYDLHQNYFSLSLSDLSLEDYYNKFKSVCEELNIYKLISLDVKTFKKQRDSMHVARFLFGLPKSLNLVKSQILASPDLPSLSEISSRLRQATLSDSSTVSSSSTNALPSNDKSSFATYMSNRGGCGGRGRGRDQGGRGRGHSLRKCTYCHGENHTVKS